MKIKSLILWYGLSALSGCQTNGYFETKEAMKLDGESSERLLEDIFVTMKENFPPAKTRLFFPHGAQRLALGLEEGFRKSGYAVATDIASKKPGDLQLSYKIDPGGDSFILLRVMAGEGFQMSRVYLREADGTLRASGPLLIRKG